MAPRSMRRIAAHATQREILRSAQSLHDRLPAWLYYRRLDREYFALAGQR